MKKNVLIRSICTCLAVCVFAGMAMASGSSTSSTTANGETKGTTAEVDNRATTTTSAAQKISESDFEIKEYIYESSIGSSYCFLGIKNNSSKAVGININMTAFDADNNVIGANSGSVDVIGAGEESIGYCWFENVSGIDHVSYNLSFDESPWYSPAVGNLDVVKTINDGNVIVTVTNNGDKAAKFVEAYALFLDSEGNVVGYESTYVVDGDSEIKPGSTISESLECYKDFDTVEVYFTGRS